MQANINYANLVSIVELKEERIEGIKSYFEKIFFYLSNNEERLSLFSLYKYLKLPFIISKRIFKLFDTNNNTYLTKESFSDGFYNLYFNKDIEFKLKLIFDLFDFNEDGTISRIDILFLLKHLLLKKTQESIIALNDIIDNTMGKQHKLNFSQWMELNINNSDIFTLVLFIFHFYQPFFEKNISFYIKKNLTLSPISNSLDNQNTNDNSDDYLLSIPIILADSTKNLFDFINEMFEYNLEYVEEDTLSNESLEDLANFENEKSIIINKNDETVLSQSTFDTYNSNLLNCSNFLSNPILKKKFSYEAFPNFKSDLPKKKKMTLSSEYAKPLIPKDEEENSEIEGFIENPNRPGFLVKCNFFLLNNEIFVLINGKVSQIIILKNSFVTKKINYMFNSEIYQGIFVNSYNFDEKNFDQTTEACSMFTSTIVKPNFCIDKKKPEIREIKLFIKDKPSFRSLYNKLFPEFKEKIITDYFEIQNQIGKGAFGKVFIGVEKATKKKVAIKELSKEKIYSSDLGYLVWELDIFNFLKCHDNKNIIKGIAQFQDAYTIYLVYELIREGDLTSFVNVSNLTKKEIKKCLKQILEGVQFLHSFGIVHRDLKPQNILIQKTEDKDFQIKLIDFGLSRVLAPKEHCNEPCGSLLYIAPEVLNKKMYTNSCDLWSIGMILYFLLKKRLPFKGTREEIAKYYEEMDLKDFIYIDDDPTFKKIFINFLQHDPEKRGNINEFMYLL